MKQIFLLTVFFLGISKLIAQPYYSSQTQESYSNLSGGTSINTANIWSGFQTFTIPIGFSFNYMDSNFTSVQLEATGRLIFDANHYYYADMFVVSGMRDKGTSSSLSPLSYQLSGTIGNRILKIEINNATYQNDLSSTVNYQIWLYENISTIELHMGPNSVPNPSSTFSLGPFSGVNHLTSFSPLTYAYGLALFNSPILPSDTTLTGTGINSSAITLSDIPKDSTVYRFSKNPTSVGINSLENHIQFRVFPNPSTGLFTFEKSNALKKEIQIRLLDSNSKLILEKVIPVEMQKAEIDIRNYSNGIYYLQLIVDDKQLVEQILKN